MPPRASKKAAKPASKKASAAAPQDAFETRAIHAGQEPDPTTGAVVVPIHPTTTYAQEGLGGHKGFEYSRTGNPTRKALETCIASLEGGERGLAFASGMATLTTISFLLQNGDHVILEENAYGGSVRYFNNIANKMGLETTYVDCSKLQNVEDAFRKNTKMLIAETPTNPNLKLNDIEKIADITHEHGALLTIDNTFATPYLQQPIALGADIVYHSATKYLGGHSDSVSGVAVTRTKELGDRLAYYQNAAGAILSPFDSYLVLRGIKTLGVRMDRHGENALALAEFLAQHPKVEYVNYPFLETHPQYKLARRQMKNGSGLISFEVKGGLAGAKRFLKDTGVWTLAESLGAVESLICHPVSMTHGSVPVEQRKRAGITDGLLRLSVGLENVADLQRDLEKALRAV
ncbi:MAG TPA: PLP-dependent aspartate aminotransferase family protein [Candidatus Thermoplasmatota archaeon]|nr:PLP-dependent aspartate aminotransferase family protein [Candidatus Thermoplasmatota archaeon]